MFDPTMLSVYPTESALPATKAENAPRRRYELNENSGRLSYSVRKCVKFGINSGPVWRWVGGCRTSRIASGEVGWSRVVDGFGGSNDMTRIVQYPARPMTRGLCGVACLDALVHVIWHAVFSLAGMLMGYLHLQAGRDER